MNPCILNKHKYRVRAAQRFQDSKIAYYMFQCEYCLHEYHARSDDLWSEKPVRILHNLKLEAITITPTGMGEIIDVMTPAAMRASVNMPMRVIDFEAHRQRRDLLSPKRRGW